MRIRRALVPSVLAITLVAALAAPVAVVAPAAASDSFRFSSSERCLMRRVNALRERRGMNRLRWDEQLGYVGRLHAHNMAQARSVFHDRHLGSRVTRWVRLGQNSGRGEGCRSLARSFRRSRQHRSTMLGDWRYLGVGVVERKGTLYVQEIFESWRDPGNVYHAP